VEKLFAVAFVSLFLFGCICCVPPPESGAAPTPVYTATPAPTPQPTATGTPARTPTPLATPAATPPPAGYSGIEQRVFELTNEQRAGQGLPALSQNSALGNSARWQACCCGEHDILEHNSEECGTVNGRLIMFGVMEQGAENLAQVPDAYRYVAGTMQPVGLYSEEEIAQHVVTGWMNSPPHRANILDARYTDLGVGVCKSGHFYYAAQNFIISGNCGYEGMPCCEEFGGYSCYLPAECDMGGHICRRVG